MYKPTYHTLSKRGYITLLALLVSIITFAQGVTVKGTILDENKEPLIGATVQVKGETTGAAADLDGNFTLKAKKNATLVVSYIGYLTQEVRLQGKTQVTIQLIPDSKTLDEVVVVGYGTMKKSDLTGSRSLRCSQRYRRIPDQFCSWSIGRSNCRCTNHLYRWYSGRRFQHQHPRCGNINRRRISALHRRRF